MVIKLLFKITKGIEFFSKLRDKKCKGIFVKEIILKVIPYTDIFLSPFVYLTALFLKCIRKIGIQKLPICKKALLNVGVFPVRNHYYEPQFDFRDVDNSFSKDRELPGINWNVQGQLNFLKEFSFSLELEKFPTEKTDNLEFYYKNRAFESGDAEYWYQLIRLKKPKNIFEVGSGNSTLMAINAINKNNEEDGSYQCKHICIEPYEMPWLEQTNVSVVREKVENLEVSFFAELEEGDILFIDSSHIIRPEGDVLFEFLQLLPILKKGVIVHIHDIFSPRNYLDTWIGNEVRFWNEQYLLEAFLTHNTSWSIMGSLNYLHHNHYDELKKICPLLTKDREPGSFYLQKTA